jgi:hypothetical protein
MEARNRNNIQYYAMLFGTYLGIFWILKFPFFPLGIRYPFLIIVFVGLTLAVPFLAYYYARQFRDKICGGTISFVNSWILLLLMYVFASLLTAIAHFIYFRFIDGEFLMDTYADMLKSIKNNPMLPKNYYIEAKAMISQLQSLTPIKITLQLISQNVFYGNILALITAPFVMKRIK